MDIALLVGLCILLAIAIAGIAFVYSYYIYSKNRLFSKIQFPVIPVTITSVLFVCLLIFVILVGINFSSKANPYFGAYLALGILLLVATADYIIAFILTYFYSNENKIDYMDIPNIDWKAKEAELSKKYDIEAVKAKLSAKNPKYYTSMLEYYKTIVSRMGQKNLPISETIADIVTFNDAFTHKWCGFLNVYQLQLTYKFLMVFQKNPGQK